MRMKLSDLKIDPEFEAKIPKLTEDELVLLEQNIVEDGKVINPIVIWNKTILDGHNRFRILQKHPEIPFDVLEKDFPDRYAAIAWICKNQLGRRNLTPEQKKYLIGKQYEAEKMSKGAKDGFRGNQYSNKVVNPQSEDLPKDNRTVTRIAKEHLPQIFKMKTCGQTKTTEPYLQVRLLLKVEEQIAKEAEQKHRDNGGDRRSKEYKESATANLPQAIEEKKRNDTTVITPQPIWRTVQILCRKTS